MSGPNWVALLDCHKDIPRSTLANAVMVLQHDPDLGPTRLYYDEFLDCVLTRNSELRAWRDDDDTRLTVYMQQQVGMLTIAESHVASAVRYVARQRTQHCGRDWIASLTWDGTPRIAHAFQDYWGATITDTQPEDYLHAASANFLRGAVARLLRPGCQVDTMPVFEGQQGIGKSQMLRALGGPWYMAATESVTSKDFQQAFRGAWIIEIPELDAFSRADKERVKSIISTPVDRYRPSYGRYARDFPRQCVFAGTTNKDDWGNDDTGLRRFWPIRCGDVDPVGFAGARVQLIAEAAADLASGATWWDMPASTTLAIQRDRQSDDIWTDLVLDYLKGKASVRLDDVLIQACKVHEAHLTHAMKLRAGSILRLAQWTKVNRRLNGTQSKTWVAPEDA